MTTMIFPHDRMQCAVRELDKWRIRHERREAARDEILSQIDDIEIRAEEAARNVRVLDYVHELLKIIASKREARVRDRLETLVTQALRIVFEDDSYSFFIEQSIKRDQASATLMLEKSDEDGNLFRTPIRGFHGGGVVDIIAFVLNAIILKLVRPLRRQTMWLDEPFSQVSKSYRPRVAEMLRWLHEETGLQFVIVTHEQEYISVADTVTRISQTSGRTVVKYG